VKKKRRNKVREEVFVKILVVAIGVLGLAIGVYTLLVETSLSEVIGGISLGGACLAGAGSIMAFRKRRLLCNVLWMIALALAFWGGVNAPSWLVRLMVNAG